MPGRKSLIIIPSEQMSNNKKEGREENSLVRMSASTRKAMRYGSDKVELWSEREKSMLLDIFQAFVGDIRKVKQLVQDGTISQNDLNRIGFVTKKTYQQITGKKTDDACDIWISNKIENTVIGADPEFLLFKGSDVMRANYVSGFSKTGLLGYDGPWAEVRPAPATSAKALVANMKKIFKDKRYTEIINEYQWLSECYHKDSQRDYPVGGHIHIGNPLQIAKLTVANRTRFFKVLNKILDELVSLPLTRLDGEKGKLRRTKGTYQSYGYFGEWRMCDGRLEHRTLSGLWLAHPVLAETILGVTKAIVDEVFRLVSENKFGSDYMMLPDKYSNSRSVGDRADVFSTNFNGWKDVPLAADMRCVKSSSDLRVQLRESSAQAINKEYLKAWTNTMKSLSTYKTNAKYIDRLAEMLSLPVKHLKDIKTDLKKNWLEGEKFQF